MRSVGRRAAGRLVAASAIVAALGIAALAARPALERRLRARIEAEAARRGLAARMEGLRVGLWPPLLLTGLEVERPGAFRLTAGAVEVWWPGRVRLVVGRATLRGPSGVTIDAPATAWDVADPGGGRFRVALVGPRAAIEAEGVALEAARSVGPEGATWSVVARDLPAGRLFDVRRSDRPLLDGGTVTGSLRRAEESGEVRFDLDLAARAARLPALADKESEVAGGAAATEEAALGEPTDLEARVAGIWRRQDGVLQVPRWHATVDGAALKGSLALRDLGSDPSVDLALDVERVDFARLLRTSGLRAPETLGAPAGGPDDGGGDLGSATLRARARGRLSDPASFVVTQKLEFTPPRRLPPAIERLKGDFVFEAGGAGGGAAVGPGAGAGGGAGPDAGRRIDVSPASSDFIPLADVPPLFLRALLLAEDAGFYNHPGIDLREMPAALLTDWARGGRARGASTITQQLAKNLFLSRDKRLGRKLQELSLTLLLESALGKSRILEIYLNVIEWGPGLYGLRPAARAYFGREPGDLTPAQMAFLVELIPGPVKYQSSFAHGTPGPGLRQLMNALLAKLRSVGALTEEEYQRSLEEEIVVQGREPRPPGSG